MIDEKRLLEVLEKNFYGIGGVEVLKQIINEQPKVGEWISVEERLPKEAGVYRVTCLYDDKVYRVKDDLFYSDRSWGYDNHHLNRKVIAWKPLEKPYKEAENDQRNKID